MLQISGVASAAEYDDIGISHTDISGFLSALRLAASKVDTEALCDLLAYPIQIGHKTDKTLTTLTSKRTCLEQSNMIFTSKILEEMRGISFYNLVEVQSMLMAFHGDFWVSKHYIGSVPLEKNPARMDFSDGEIWKMKIVQINLD